MKRYFLFAVLIQCMFAPLIGASALAQGGAPGAFKPGQTVQVEYVPDSGKWFPATIMEVLNDGYSYKVKVAPWSDGKSVVTNIHFKRVRLASAQKAAPAKKTNVNEKIYSLVLGKYGCTSTLYHAAQEKYEFIPKGSFTLGAGGSYQYNGFKNPSKGRFSFNKKAGHITFKGGYLNGGVATPISGYANRFYLVAPVINDRWTCSLMKK